MKMLAFAARALGLAALVFTVGAAAPGSRLKVGEMAPDAELVLINGSKIRLSQLRGQVIVLNFWATWCVPCRKELPTLDTYQRIRKANGLRVIAVATEDSLPAYKLKPLFAALSIDSAKRISRPYSALEGVPTNFIIDRAGRLRYAKAAAFDLDDLNRELVPLLNERPPATNP